VSGTDRWVQDVSNKSMTAIRYHMYSPILCKVDGVNDDGGSA
jgi:hypothetical protein